MRKRTYFGFGLARRSQNMRKTRFDSSPTNSSFKIHGQGGKGLSSKSALGSGYRFHGSGMQLPGAAFSRKKRGSGQHISGAGYHFTGSGIYKRGLGKSVRKGKERHVHRGKMPRVQRRVRVI